MVENLICFALWALVFFSIFIAYNRFSYKLIGMSLLLYLLLKELYLESSIIITTIIVTIVVILNVSFLRRLFLTRAIFSVIKKKKLIPKISNTEKVVIETGSAWIDKDLFSGKPNVKKMLSEPYNALTRIESAFLKNEVNELCAMVDDWSINCSRDLPPNVWKYLKEKKFFGIVIPKTYGGLGFSALANNMIVQKLVSRSTTLAITTMVPNSLGPGELLVKYGSKQQKDYYLPRLASGKEIPCFGLTELNAGSDATSIQSDGIVFLDKNNNIKVRLNWEKRYITLGSIATIIGIAFKLKDPDNILGKGNELGITCALVPSKTKGVITKRRHDPLGVPFINSPLTGIDVEIDIKDIIGEEKGVGKGWQMLMECLAVGRGISLPALATGGVKYLYRVTSAYAKFRKQFNTSIANFEGIQEVLVKIGGYTYMLESASVFTASAVSRGKAPAVINGILKYHATEKYREVINASMDILGGAGIIKGPKNLIANAYMGTPISITVEGANIMTRSLMHFGQGVTMCHPYIYDEFQAIEDNNIKKFDKAFFGHIKHLINNVVRSVLLSVTRGYLTLSFNTDLISYYKRKISWISASFAATSDIFILIYGGNLKKKEIISGRLGDILSYMYLVTSIIRRYINDGYQEESKIYVKWGLDYCFSEIDKRYNEIYNNFSSPVLGSIFKLFFATWSRINPIKVGCSDSLTDKIAKDMVNNQKNRDFLTNGIFIPEKIEGLGYYEEAYKNTFKIDNILQKVKLALKKEKKKFSNNDEMLNFAYKNKIIDKKTLNSYQLCKDSIQEALKVDSFLIKDYLSHQMSNSITDVNVILPKGK